MLPGVSPTCFGVLFCSVVQNRTVGQKSPTVGLAGCRCTPETTGACSHNSAWFITGGVFKWNIAHRRSVAVLCMMYKNRCSPMQQFNDALPGPYLLVWVTRGALVAHLYTYAPPGCRTSQNRRTFVLPFSVPLERSCWPRIRGCGTGGFEEQGRCFLIGLRCCILTI